MWCFSMLLSIRESVISFCSFCNFCSFYKFVFVSLWCPAFDAYELFRAAHSHNSTLYSHIVGLSFLHYNHGYRSVVKSYWRIEKPQAVVPRVFRFLMRGEIVSSSTIWNTYYRKNMYRMCTNSNLILKWILRFYKLWKVLPDTKKPQASYLRLSGFLWGGEIVSSSTIWNTYYRENVSILCSKN